MKTSDLRKMMLDITKNNGLDILHQSIEQFDYAEPIRVAFLGEFTTGKSTMINALLKKPLIPMLDKPTNANPIEIKRSSEDRFELVRWIDDKEETSTIEQDEIIKEVTEYEAGKRIHLYLKDADILKDDVVIIDTPGVSSILEHHTEVTFGYLPVLDAAIITISAITGEVPDSILDFIEKEITPIAGLRDRLFFCVTMLDLVSADKRETVYNQIKKTLDKVIPNARIAALSPNQILEYAINDDLDSYEKSGIGKLVDFISDELPAMMDKIQDEKLCKHLIALKETLIGQLDAKRTTLDYSTTDLDKEIEKVQEQIGELKRKISILKKDVDDAEDKIRTRISQEQDNLVDAIAVKAEEDLDYTADIIDFSETVKDIIKVNYSRINIPNETAHVKFEDIVKNKLDPMISGINQAMDLAANIITMAVTALIIPGKTALDAVGAGTVAVQEAGKKAGKKTAGALAKQAARKANFLKFLGFVGKVIDQINPIENLKDIIKLPILKAKVKSKLNLTLNQLLASIFDIIHENLEYYIEETYNKPMMQYYETLNKTRREKAGHIEELDRMRERIKVDVQRLRDNNC